MSNSFARVAPRHSQSIHANAVDLWSELPRREGSPLIDLPRLGAFLARRWLLILLTTITVTGAFLLLAHFMFNKYTASALIMVDPRSTRVTQGQEVLSNFGSDAFAIESVVQIAKSESFLGKIVDRLGLGEDSEFGGGQSPRASAVDRLGGRLAIARRGATYVIDVAATSTDAQKSMRIANNAAQLIVEEQSRTRSDSTENAVTWLSTRINELQEKLRRSENAAASLKAKLKLTDAGQGFTLQERRIAELSRQSVVESARTAEARARLDQLRSSAAGVDQLPSSIQSPLLTTLRQELARLGRTLSDQATLLGERHPELVSMRAQIAGIRQQIKAEIANLRTAATTDLKEAQNREAAIAKQLREAQAQSGEQGQEAVGLAELEREAKADRAVYEQLLTRLKELSEFRDMKSLDVRVAEPAVAPHQTTGPKRPVILAAGLTLGLLAGLGLAAGLDWRRQTPPGLKEIEKRIGLPIVGVTPKLAGLALKAASPADCFMELAELLAGSRVVLVTSAKPGAGKSIVATQLAAAFAASVGGEVLLIEGNAPKGRSATSGLLDVLKMGASLDRVLKSPSRENFFRLSFGNPSSDPRKVEALFRGARFREVIQQCEDVFDVVLIDGPTLLGSGYATELLAVADEVVQVIDWNRGDAELIEKACRLTPNGVALLNVIDP